jgi:hypothetical protein
MVATTSSSEESLEREGPAGEHPVGEDADRAVVVVGERLVEARRSAPPAGGRLRRGEPAAGGVGREVAAAEGEQQPAGEQHGHRDRPDQVPALGLDQQVVAVHPEQHDHEQEQDHDRAGVDDHLHDPEERRLQREVQPGDRQKVHHQHQRRVDDVAHRDHGDGGAEADDREHPEDDRLGGRRPTRGLGGLGEEGGLHQRVGLRPSCRPWRARDG